MKKLLSSILVIFFFTNQAFSEQKIAFIDMDKLISASKSGSSILKQLTDHNKKNLKFNLNYYGESFPITLELGGEFNVYNLSLIHI